MMSSEEKRLTLQDRIPGEQLERVLNFKIQEFGYGGSADELVMDELISPIHYKGTEVVVTCLYNPKFYKDGQEIIGNKEDDAHKTPVTWIHIGGMGGPARTHIGDFAARLHESADNSNIKVENMVILSSPLGAIRSAPGETGFDSEDFEDSAAVLEAVLKDPAINLKRGKMVISGLSAGGAIATTLVDKLPEAEVLVLMDPAGMGESPGIGLRFMKDALIERVNEYKDRGFGTGAALKMAAVDMAKGWPGENRAPKSIFEFIRNLGESVTSKRLKNAYSLDGEKAGDTLRSELLGSDSTKKARERLGQNLKLIFSPAVGANVVNAIRQSAGWTDELIESAIKEPGSARAQLLVKQAELILASMFPNVKPENRYFLPWWGKTHAAVGTEQKYMDRIVEKVDEALKQETV